MTIQEKASRILSSAKIISLASIDEQDYPRPAPVVKLKAEDGEIYISTRANAAKTSHFWSNPKAGVSIVEKENCILYTGEVQIITDKILKNALWGDWMFDYFPCGVDDSEYTILKFMPRNAIYWIDNEFVKEELLISIK